MWPKSKLYQWQKFELCYFGRPETPDEFQAVLLHTVVELIMHILCQYSKSPWNNFLLLTLFYSTYSCSLLTIENKWMILMDRLQIFIRYDSISRNYFALRNRFFISILNDFCSFHLIRELFALDNWFKI